MTTKRDATRGRTGLDILEKWYLTVEMFNSETDVVGIGESEWKRLEQLIDEAIAAPQPDPAATVRGLVVLLERVRKLIKDNPDIRMQSKSIPADFEAHQLWRDIDAALDGEQAQAAGGEVQAREGQGG